MNMELKIELLRRFGTQVEAAKALGIRESKLSYIIRGHAEPNEQERRALENGIGEERARKLLG